jgi:hypothetical protein
MRTAVSMHRDCSTYFKSHEPFVDAFAELGEFFLEGQLFRLDFLHFTLQV